MTVPDPRLWCLHHIGPDDVHPAPDFATAQKWADWANTAFVEHAAISRFVVAIWPWDADSHSDGLEKSIADWALSTPDAVNADKALNSWSGDPHGLANELRRVANCFGEGFRIVQLLRDAADEIDTLTTPAPDKALMPEAAVGAWRSIDSAPKDRTKVDLWVVFTDWFGKDAGERLTNCLWIKQSATYEEGWHDAYGNRLEWQVDLSDPENEEVNPRNGRRVTHWMPVPDAPGTAPTPVEEPEKGATGFINAIHDASPNGVGVNVKHHPNGDWSVGEANAGQVEEALRYYANDEHYDSGDVPGHIYVLDDHGRYARAALAATNAGQVEALREAVKEGLICVDADISTREFELAEDECDAPEDDYVLKVFKERHAKMTAALKANGDAS